MTLTLLLDLDNTLLGNDMADFLPPYLQALAAHLGEFSQPEPLVAALMSATRAMVRNNDPGRTLKDVFDAAFYPTLGLTYDAVKYDQDLFYAEVFPSLQHVTTVRPEAVRLVEGALARGYRLVIATSPLFPCAAIHHRLRWAGLPPEKYDFELITTYEHFHFSKPNPAYYAEILARLGWAERPAVMVGDDFDNDILPARRLGLPAFWVHPPSDLPASPPLAPTASGGLEDVLPWLEAAPPEQLEPDFSTPDALLAILKSTPAALDCLTGDLPESAWAHKPSEGEWNLAEIICHLRDVDGEVNLPRLAKVIQEDNPFLPGMDTDPWAEERMYFCQSGSEALADFTDCRRELLALLEGLPPQDWNRPARHAIFGPTHLRELVGIIAGHDRLHLRQTHASLGVAARCLSAC